jgi:hypothetical protein
MNILVGVLVLGIIGVLVADDARQQRKRRNRRYIVVFPGRDRAMPSGGAVAVIGGLLVLAGIVYLVTQLFSWLQGPMG